MTANAADHESSHAKSALANVTRLGGSGQWGAYVDDARGGKICYLIGKPRGTGSGHAKNDGVRMSVTHRPADKVKDVVNFMLGFRARKGRGATLNIDGHKYNLFTQKSGAWTRDAATDHTVVTAMMRGRQAAIKAQPEHGGAVTESYDLNGFTAVLALIDRACDVRQ
ncbi:MAG: invasion associated locus B family protein [Stellaceae bacterium]